MSVTRRCHLQGSCSGHRFQFIATPHVTQQVSICIVFSEFVASTYLSHMFCYYLGSFYPLPLQQCRKNTCQRWNCVWNCSVLTSSGLKWRLEFIPTCTGKKSKVTQMKAGWQIKFFAQCCWRHVPLCTCTLGRSCAGHPALEIIGEKKIKSPNKINSTEMQTAKKSQWKRMDEWATLYNTATCRHRRYSWLTLGRLSAAVVKIRWRIHDPKHPERTDLLPRTSLPASSPQPPPVTHVKPVGGHFGEQPFY